MLKFITLLWLFALCLATGAAFARPEEAPNGKAIAEAAKKAKMDTKGVVVATKGEKKAKFTPADVPHDVTEEHLAKGMFIGTVEMSGKVDRFPDGRYHLFVAKEDGKWHGYAERDGKIVTRASHVTLKKEPEAKVMKKAEVSLNLFSLRICFGRYCFSFGF
jgi:hypothetical protein